MPLELADVASEMGATWSRTLRISSGRSRGACRGADPGVVPVSTVHDGEG